MTSSDIADDILRSLLTAEAENADLFLQIEDVKCVVSPRVVREAIEDSALVDIKRIFQRLPKVPSASKDIVLKSSSIGNNPGVLRIIHPSFTAEVTEVRVPRAKVLEFIQAVYDALNPVDTVCTAPVVEQTSEVYPFRKLQGKVRLLLSNLQSLVRFKGPGLSIPIKFETCVRNVLVSEVMKLLYDVIVHDMVNPLYGNAPHHRHAQILNMFSDLNPICLEGSYDAKGRRFVVYTLDKKNVPAFIQEVFEASQELIREDRDLPIVAE